MAQLQLIKGITLSQRHSLFIFCFFFYFCPFTSMAYASENADLPQVKLNDVHSGQLLFKRQTSQVTTNPLNNKQELQNITQFLQAPSLDTQAFIDIKGIVANTKVLQTFNNSTNEWQHALYVFPLPDDAAVNQLTIIIGERRIVGVVKEKGEAKQTFIKAQQAGKKAALLEQLRPNLFSMNIANIPPNESIKVELSYFQQVQVEKNTFSLHFPMAITPRYEPLDKVTQNGEKILNEGDDFFPEAKIPNLLFVKPEDTLNDELAPVELPVSKINLEVSLNSGGTLKKINSLHHSVLIKEPSEGLFNLRLNNHPLDQDFVLQWQYQAEDLPKVINFNQYYQENNYGLLMIIPGLKTQSSNQARQLTFILDKSGSMAGNSIEQAKAAFKHALSTLNQQDTFQLITFNNQAELFFEKPVAATNFNKHTAWRYVAGLTADGGTEIKSALALALTPSMQTIASSNRPGRFKQIVFLTDGAVGNEAEIFNMINQQIGDNRLFTVGLGSAPNRYFMKRAAEAGRGTYQFIGSHKTLVPVLDQLFNKLDHPALTDIALHFNDTDKLFTSSPNPIPDLYADEAIFISYKVEEPATASDPYQAELQANLQGQPWRLPLTINSDSQSSIQHPDFSEKTPSLATLWASRKIDDYYRQLMLDREHSAKDKIIALGLEFNLVTPFTSLVAVEEKISRPNHEAATQKQLSNNLPAGQQMPKTALDLTEQLILGTSLLFLGFCLLLFSSAIVANLRGKQYANH